MSNLNKKWIIAIVAFVVVIAVGSILLMWRSGHSKPEVKPIPEQESNQPKISTVGASVQGRGIKAYTYGRGKTDILFVGGMHGGYEWNSVVLAYDFMDYLVAHPDVIPNNLQITVIPSANPDGVFKIVGKEGRFAASEIPVAVDQSAGRLNADKVDLNRNFDCNWKSAGIWQNKPVSGGTSPFSEPEARAIRDFVQANHPVAAIFWHSQSGSVYASECNNGILPGTLDIMNAYAQASGYSAVKSFDSYAVTGDSEGWLASIDIPAITVELKTHQTVEWQQNLAGINALFEYFSRKSAVL